MRIPTEEEFPSHPGGQCTLSLARDVDEWKKGTIFLIAHLGLDHQRIAATAKHLQAGTLPKRGPLYDEIDEAVRKIQDEHPYQIWVYRFWCLLLTIALMASLFGLILTGHRGLAPIWGILAVSYAFNIFHARVHRGRIVYGIKWLDRLTFPLYELIDRTFMSVPESWIQHHNLSHHMATNTMSDADVTNPLKTGIRVNKHCPYKNVNRFQHIYTHFLLAFNLFLFPLKNVQSGGSSWFFLLHYVLLYALPVYVQDDWEMAKWTFLVVMVMSSVISHLFQVSHNHAELGKARHNFEDGATKDIDLWLVHQITEAISWGGYFSNLIVGGINNQIEHHVAPCLCPIYYHYLAIELQEICRKRNIPYIRLDSFPEAVVSYHRHLYKMGRKPEASQKKLV